MTLLIDRHTFAGQTGRMSRRLFTGLTTLFCLTVPGFFIDCAHAQESGLTATAAASTALRPLMHTQTDHQGTFGGKAIRFTAIVDEAPVKDALGNTVATIVSTSYIRSDGPKGSNRPILFAFNGGPGSASVWLHMGLLGPKRVAFQDDTKPETTAPFQLIDNPESPLDVADIVIIDPPGTGYSQVAPGHEGDVYGTDEDARAVAGFIESWLLQHHRQNSPKYLFGESYGTIRAARLAKLMAGGPSETGSMTGISLNGVFLLGQAMDLTPDGDLEFLTTLPTLAACAWYHGAIDKTVTSLETQVADAKAFAAGEYLRVLYLGDAATAADKASVTTELNRLTGLSTDFIARHNLRISAHEFASEVLASQNLQIGMYDARFTLPLQASGNDPVADDPAMGQYVPGYLGAWSEYARKDLGLSTTAPYRAIEFRAINSRWNWGQGPGVASTQNYAEDLAVAMRRNPSLKLLVGEGVYDLVTTPGKADYTISHAGINPARVTYTHYAAGHMSYLGSENRIAVATDLRRFLQE